MSVAGVVAANTERVCISDFIICIIMIILCFLSILLFMVVIGGDKRFPVERRTFDNVVLYGPCRKASDVKYINENKSMNYIIYYNYVIYYNYFRVILHLVMSRVSIRIFPIRHQFINYNIYIVYIYNYNNYNIYSIYIYITIIYNIHKLQ
eukprot:Tbor_TRINITY_DN5634_c2_g6::TRINITY_DN5634_c2_g6_i1::g.9312::m.9312